MTHPPRDRPPPTGDAPASGKPLGQSLRAAAGLFAYLLPYKYKFIAALFALFVASLLALAFPYIAGKLVDTALVKAGFEKSTQSTTDQLDTLAKRIEFWQADVNTIALALFVALVLQALFLFLRSIWFAEVAERSLADLRGDTYARLIQLPMAFYSQRRVGELAGRLSTDLTHIQDALIWTIPQFLRQATILVGGVTLIALTSGKLTLVMLGSLPPLIGVAILLGRKIRRVAREAQDKLADSNVVVEETLQGIASVKAFANEGYELGRYRNSLQVFVQTVLRGAWYRGFFASFIVFALFGAVVLVLWYGATLVQKGELSAGELTRFMLYTMFVGGAMGSFAELYAQIQRSIGASQRVRELLQETPEPLELAVPASPSLPARNSTLKLRGDVAYEHVTFAYPARKEVQVLNNLSLTVTAGERVALVGPSGAGKSTLVALLLRFYDPDSGRILIDGSDARDYALHALRKQMAVVPQDVILFGGTIAENIAYGKPGAGQVEIEEAARKAHAHDFIRGFPEGYQTVVGERGIKLSGGQRQRVAIARAILKNPAILILDEATSSLDSESESLVQQGLEVLMQGRTSLIIAHRLATVRTADRIFVIKEGALVEAGTHAELIEREEGVYRTLSELQFDLH